MSEIEKSFHTLVCEIQSELKAPKSQINKFGNYNYRNCEDILQAVKPLLFERDLVLTITDSVELIGDRFYIKATSRIWDAAGETFESVGYARESVDKKGMDVSQITGAASSYARKYSLNGLLAIDDTKDADSDNKHDQQIDRIQPSQTQRTPMISKKQAEYLESLLVKSGKTPTEQTRAWINGLNIQQAKDQIEKLKNESGMK